MKTSGPKPVKAVIKDRTAERALDANYQNLTGRPLLVFVTAVCSKKDAGDNAFIEGRVDVATPPGVMVARNGLSLLAGTAIQDMQAMVAFAVTPGHYYSVASQKTGASLVTMVAWIEVEL